MNTPTGRLLIVDNDKLGLRALEQALKKEGHEVVTTQSGANALAHLDKQAFDVVLAEARMEKVDGLQILQRCRANSPETAVILTAAQATPEAAVAAIKHGAYHYFAKPIACAALCQVVGEALTQSRLRRAHPPHAETGKGKVSILTQNAEMQRLLDMARQIAPTDCNVLITGESGTGKELFARYLHQQGKRNAGPFLAINCGAFNEELLANELFGHVKGAFTGAHADQQGLIAAAHGGTLFLDEITEMAPAMQVKLLRVLQEREVLPLGATQPQAVDVRYVAATNRDVIAMMKDGDFRQDLYFRLNVVNLLIPPLSRRKEDVQLLAYHFIQKCAARMDKDVDTITPDALDLLKTYDFPGNVRELENIIERGVAIASGKIIDAASLPDDLRDLAIRTFRKKDGRLPSLAEQERDYIRWVLQEAGGNQTLAAQILGIDRVSLWRKLKRYEMD